MDKQLNDPVGYDTNIIAIVALEISKGYTIEKINNATKNGTKIKFRCLEKNEKIDKVFDDLTALLTEKFKKRRDLLNENKKETYEN